MDKDNITDRELLIRIDERVNVLKENFDRHIEDEKSNWRGVLVALGTAVTSLLVAVFKNR